MFNWFPTSFNYNNGICTWNGPLVSTPGYSEVSHYDSIFYQDMLPMNRNWMDESLRYASLKYEEQRKKAESAADSKKPEAVDNSSQKTDDTKKPEADKKTDDKKSEEAKQADEAKKAEKKAKQEKAAEIAADAYTAMSGIGTNDEKLKRAVYRINSDNVIEVMDLFNNTYKDGGILEWIRCDTSGDFETELESHIAKALYQRAEKAGIAHEANLTRGAFEGALNGLYTSRTGMIDALNTLTDKIKKAEKAKESQNASSGKKDETEDDSLEQAEVPYYSAQQIWGPAGYLGSAGLSNGYMF